MHTVLGALFGPIFAKEAIEVARRKRYLVPRLLYGGALLFVVLVVWIAWADRFNGGQVSIAQMARIAEALFLGVSIVQFVSVFLLVPLFLCGVLAGEREEHTLELLFTTHLHNRDLVLGKLASRLAAFGLIVLSGLPVLSLIMLWGGVDPNALMRTTLSTLLAALFVGSHAVYFSAITKSPLGALVRTYWWLAIEMAALPFLALLPIMATTPGPRAPAAMVYFTVLLTTNPGALFVIGLEGGFYNALVGFLGGQWFYALGFPLPLLYSAFLIWRAIRAVRRDPTPFRRPRLVPMRLRSGVARASRALGEVGGAWRAVTASFSLNWLARNPFWVRARQVRVYDREGYIRRIQTGFWILAFGILSMVATFENRTLRHDETAIGFVACSWVGIALLGLLFAGASLAGDRRRGFLDLALTTPLTGREVVDGTLLAVWEHLRRVLLLPLILAVVFALTGASSPVGILFSAGTALMLLMVWILYGVGCSLASRTTTGALATTFVLPVVSFAAPLLLMGVFPRHYVAPLWGLTLLALVVGWRWTRFSASAAAVCFWLTALHLAIGCLTSCWTFGGHRSEWPVAGMHGGFLSLVGHGRNFEREFGDRPWVAVYGSYWLGLVAFFLLARWWLIRHFDRLVGRKADFVEGGWRMRRPASAVAVAPRVSDEGVFASPGR